MTRAYRASPPPPDVLRQRWYARPNDRIVRRGLWSAVNVDKPPSQLDPMLGEVEVAHFADERIARHVVSVHNTDLDGPAGATARLALLLLESRDRDGAVKLSQTELAERLGYSTVHVAKVIRTWRDRGLVATAHRYIRVCDGRALAAQARL